MGAGCELKRYVVFLSLLSLYPPFRAVFEQGKIVVACGAPPTKHAPGQLATRGTNPAGAVAKHKTEDA